MDLERGMIWLKKKLRQDLENVDCTSLPRISRSAISTSWAIFPPVHSLFTFKNQMRLNPPPPLDYLFHLPPKVPLRIFESTDIYIYIYITERIKEDASILCCGAEPVRDLGSNNNIHQDIKMADLYSICCTQRIVLYETKAVNIIFRIRDKNLIICYNNNFFRPSCRGSSSLARIMQKLAFVFWK